ncbi:hypothetical protein GCM10023213_23430 [Prosthecobacter algae]|uniref:Uncharacterized protein n=1 Tax=Prosthecobacter algae TaxID=1144682 RepID=A0ABP9P4V3_9BACT
MEVGAEAVGEMDGAVEGVIGTDVVTGFGVLEGFLHEGLDEFLLGKHFLFLGGGFAAQLSIEAIVVASSVDDHAWASDTFGGTRLGACLDHEVVFAFGAGAVGGAVGLADGGSEG